MTSLSDKDLMGLFSQFVSWQNYVDQQFSDAEMQEASCLSEKHVAEALAMAGSSAKQVAKQKAEMLSNPTVQQKDEAWLKAKAMRKALAIQRDALERMSNFLSRELSRRISREPVERRQSRFNP